MSNNLLGHLRIRIPKACSCFTQANPIPLQVCRPQIPSLDSGANIPCHAFHLSQNHVGGRQVLHDYQGMLLVVVVHFWHVLWAQLSLLAQGVRLIPYPLLHNTVNLTIDTCRRATSNRVTAGWQWTSMLIPALHSRGSGFRARGKASAQAGGYSRRHVLSYVALGPCRHVHRA